MTLQVLQTSYRPAKIGRPHSHSNYLKNNLLKSRTFLLNECTGSFLALERKGSGFTVVFSVEEKRRCSQTWEVRWQVRRLLGTVLLPEER